MLTRLALALAVLAPVAACFDDDGNSVVVNPNDPVNAAEDVGQKAGAEVAKIVGDELGADDYQTVLSKAASILAQINNNVISTSNLAVDVAPEEHVVDFANELVDDHHNLMTSLDDAVRFYGVPYIVNDAQAALSLQNQAATSLLRSTPSSEFDFVFTQMQVTALAEYEVVLDTLRPLVGPGEMEDYINEAHDVIDDNLEEAKNHLDDFYN